MITQIVDVSADGTVLRQLLESIAATPSNDVYLVRLTDGSYNLGPADLVVPSNVHIVGADPARTTLGGPVTIYVEGSLRSLTSNAALFWFSGSPALDLRVEGAVASTVFTAPTSVVIERSDFSGGTLLLYHGGIVRHTAVQSPTTGIFVYYISYLTLNDVRISAPLGVLMSQETGLSMDFSTIDGNVGVRHTGCGYYVRVESSAVRASGNASIGLDIAYGTTNSVSNSVVRALEGTGIRTSGGGPPATTSIRGSEVLGTLHSVESTGASTVVTSSQLSGGPVDGTGFTCAGVVDPLFAPLDANCLPAQP